MEEAKEERKRESEEYFNSKSPPSKKQRISNFDDDSDDEDVQATLVMKGEEIFSSSDDEGETEEDNNNSPIRSSTSQSVISTKKHDDLNDKKVRTLIKTIFNEKVRELSLKQLGIPKETKENYYESLDQIDEILKEIQTVLECDVNERDGKQLLKLSYDYYCLLPTISPIPSYISSFSELYNKFQSLYFLHKINKFKQMKSLTEQYLSLNSKITSISRSSEIFKLILQSIGSTNYPRIPCVIKDIFEVERKNDEFTSVEPRMLLWYGCHLAIAPDIIRNSLQLPNGNNPKFPCGNAIYLYDMFSEGLKQAKSFTVEDYPHCTLFLCEVSLGQIFSIRQKEKFDSPPNGNNSIKCVGRSYYNPNNSIKTPNGCELVSGKILPNGIYGTEWEFNKYGLFNPNQIRIKYIIHVELTPTNKNTIPIHLPFGPIVARGIWKYSSGKKWVSYESELSTKIEENYQRNQKIIHVTIAGSNYTINLDHMVQYQTQNPKKSRKIKRE